MFGVLHNYHNFSWTAIANFMRTPQNTMWKKCEENCDDVIIAKNTQFRKKYAWNTSQPKKITEHVKIYQAKFYKLSPWCVYFLDPWCGVYQDFMGAYMIGLLGHITNRALQVLFRIPFISRFNFGDLFSRINSFSKWRNFLMKTSFSTNFFLFERETPVQLIAT